MQGEGVTQGPTRDPGWRTALTRGGWLAAAVMGLILTLVTSMLLRASDERARREDFARASQTVIRGLEGRLGYVTHELQQLAYVLGQEVFHDPAVFNAYVKYVFDIEHGLQALEWAPMVPHSSRQQFEADAVRHHPGYRIRTFGPQHLPAPPSMHDHYFPVLFAFPSMANAQAIGLDLSSELQRQAAIGRAVANGHAAATSSVKLLQDDPQHVALLVVAPVYSVDSSQDKVLKGVATVVLCLQDFIKPSLLGKDASALSVRLTDQTTASSQPVLFQRAAFDTTDTSTLLSTSHRIQVADRSLQLDLAAKPDSFGPESNRANGVLALGLALSLTLLAFGYRAKQRNRHIGELSAQLQAILQHSPSIIFLKDPSGKYLAINAASRQFMHQPIQEAMGKTDLDLFPKALAQQFRHGDLEALAAQTPIEHEELATSNDGAIHHLLISKFSVRDKQGAIIGVGGIATDISERKRMENELREKEVMFRTFTDHLPMIFWLSNPARTQWHFVSAAYEEIFGRPRADLYRHPEVWRQSIHPGDLACVSASLQEQSGTDPSVEEFRVVRPDGDLRWVMNRTIPLRNENGEVNMLVGMVQDVTDRKIVERVWRGMVEASGSPDSVTYFTAVARSLGSALKASHALIARVIDGERMCTLGLYVDGTVSQNIEYDLPGTLSEAILLHGARATVSGARLQFPRDTMLETWQSECFSGAPIPDRNGNMMGVVIVAGAQPFRDASVVQRAVAIVAARAGVEYDRFEVRHNLQLSESRFAGIINSAMDAIITLDKDLKVVLFNPAAERIFRCRADTVLGQELDRFLPEEVHDSHAGSIREFAATGLTTRASNPHKVLTAVRADGTAFPAQASISRSAADGQEYYTVVLRDVTTHVESERQLQAWSQRYQAAIDASGQMLYDWDIALDEVLYAGDLLRILGYTPAELNGPSTRWLELIHPEDRRSFTTERARCLQNNLPFSLAYRMLHRDGRVLHCEDVGRFIHDNQDRPERLIGFVADVTVRKTAEAEFKAMETQLRQAQKMEALGHLTGGIAHDFNNILASIRGYSGLARAQPETRKSEKLEGYLREVSLATDRARDLVAQMLAFGRKPMGRPKVVALQPLIGEVVSMLSATLPATIQLLIRPAVVPLFVRIDPVNLQQVLLNLCLNARDAISGSGKITLETEQVVTPQATRCASCHAAVTGPYIRITVADNGPGIPHDIREHIFEPFFTTKQTGRGSGMGLAVVHGIVHEREGHLLIDSDVNGTAFHILLPAAPQAALQPIESRTLAPFPASVTARQIVLIDDDPMITDYLRELLTGAGYAVQVFNHPREALTWISDMSHPTHLILTDRNMPDLTGMDVASAITRHRSDLPIILLSGFLEIDDEIAAKRAGIRRVCSKPIDNDDLLRVIAEELREVQVA